MCDDDELPQKLDLRALQVREEVGQSASATFWKASYNGQDIALKILHAKPKSKAGAVTAADGCSTAPNEENLREKLFLREAKIMLQIGHRHLVKCFGVAQLPGGFAPNQPAPALAMALELCEPQTLKDLITRGMMAGRRQYKTGEAYRWLTQVAAALSYLHSQKPPVIHRDIRADSVLTKRVAGSADVSCKLSDLGLHAVLYDDRSNALRRRAFTQTIFNPLADAAVGEDSSQRAGNGCEEEAAAAAAAEARPAPHCPPTPSSTGASGHASAPANLPPPAPTTSPPIIHGTAGATSLEAKGGSGRGGSGCGGSRSSGGSSAAVEGAGPAAAACLGNVESLLRQLGGRELQPLQPSELELVYTWPDKAESFLYMAPEVYNNLPSTERSDVFSFGVLAYELLGGELLSVSIFNTGRAARMGVRDPPAYAAKVSEGFRPARIQALSDAAWALIESCWHPDPVQRPTMAAVEGQLAELVREMEGAPAAAAQPASPSPKGGKVPWDAGVGGKTQRAPVDGPSPGCTQQCVIC